MLAIATAKEPTALCKRILFSFVYLLLICSRIK